MAEKALPIESDLLRLLRKTAFGPKAVSKFLKAITREKGKPMTTHSLLDSRSLPFPCFCSIIADSKLAAVVRDDKGYSLALTLHPLSSEEAARSRGQRVAFCYDDTPPYGSQRKIRREGERDMRVYLAGNLHSDWRSKIIDLCPNIQFLQPYKDDKQQFFRTVEGTATLPIDWYVTRDLLFVRCSDLLLGYITNYGQHSRHHGLMIELGFAKALGIAIVLVSEMPIFDMAEGIADVVFRTIPEATNYLNFLVEGNPI